MRCVLVGEERDGEVIQSSWAGLRPVRFEGTHVQEGDLLVVRAKRRRSPRPATQNGPVLSA
jgi:hypothetical protein